jgi:DNA invertase Pin-like site-specific DNA recombinase
MTLNPQRAAIYIRVSDPRQEEGYSFEFQEDSCRQFVTEHGWTIDPKHVFREVQSGAVLDERPELTRLRSAIDRREIDRVIIF